MKYLVPLILYSFLFCSPLQAQVVVTSESFPVAGDTLFTRVDITPMISTGRSGPMQTWEFDNLSSPALNETIFVNPNFGSSTAFNDATALNIGDGGTEFYYDSDENAFFELGIFGADPLLGVFNVNARYTQPLILRRAPLNYGDVNQQSTNLLFPFSSEIIPDTFLNSLPFQPDSIRLNIAIQRADTVDAYGTLNVNMVGYEVLREKRIEIRTVGVDALLPFVGWQDVTPIINQILPQFGAGSSDTLRSYYYFAEDLKEPVAVVGVNDMDTPQRVEFRDLMMTNLDGFSFNQPINITAAPNPSIGFVEFVITNAPSSVYKLKVRNIIGQTLWDKDIFVSGRERIRVDLTHLKRGTYFYSLTDQSGNVISTKRLIFIRA